MYERPFSDPPDHIVENGAFRYGCYSGPCGEANMLDVHRPYHYAIPRLLKAFRRKEWRAFRFGDARFFGFTVMYDAKLFQLVVFSLYDRETKRSFGFKRIFPFPLFKLGERLDGDRIVFRRRRCRLEYLTSLSEGIVLVSVSIRGHGKPKMAGRFEFTYNARQTAPFSVCLPLGLNRALYTAKVLMPMRGSFKVGDEGYVFDGTTSMGVMEENKGYYPYHMYSDWVSGFGVDAKGRRVGFNLCDNQVKDQTRFNENALWINSRVFALPPIRITRPNGIEGDWIIQDMEGMVDLAFKPEKRNDIMLDLIIAKTDYHGPYGSFTGTLKTQDGEKIDVSSLFGMGEKKFLRS